MKNIRSILTSVALIVFGINAMNAQCCNVISTNGIKAITSNGICAITADGLGGDCNEMKKTVDTDGDGVADELDKCPSVFGIAANKGCPAISEEIKSTLLNAANIQFATSSDVILKESFTNLDAVALIMESNPAYKLMLSGYTDNTGDATFNTELSKKRAAAAKTYLINKGVAASRITSDGFGAANPVAPNDTPEGRKKNRRVEFKVLF